MCGILGVYSKNKSIDNSVINSAVKSLSHRGPDGSGYNLIEKNNGFLLIGHTRLAIIDVSDSGHQPMSTDNGRYFITYNGEIYNYKELAEKYNITLTTGSDCEIIIHLSNILPINEYIKLLDGVFSFVLYAFFYFFLISAWAAASLAIGTLYGEHET